MKSKLDRRFDLASSPLPPNALSFALLLRRKATPLPLNRFATVDLRRKMKTGAWPTPASPFNPLPICLPTVPKLPLPSSTRP